MPAKSEKQRRFMAAEYGRAKAGKKTKTGMAPAKLHDYMSRPTSSMVGALKGPWGDVGEKRQMEARKLGGFVAPPVCAYKEF